MNFKTLTALAAVALSSQAFAGTASISIDMAKKGPAINPKMYGIFLEEINHGVDGGLYAEMVKNRAFENNTPPEGAILKDGRWFNKSGWDTGFQQDPSGLPSWSLIQSGGAKATMTLSDQGLNKKTPHALEFKIENASGRAAVANEGFWGMNIEQGASYNLSLYARCGDGFKGSLTVTLEDTEGKTCTKPVTLSGVGSGWKQFKAVIVGTETNHKARLVISAGSTGTVWFDYVSLMPAKTWKKDLPLRPDIAQMIADLKPTFVRFPGGCVVEGGTTDTAYNWKDTVGALEERTEKYNCWGYRRTHGIGFYEYLKFIEALQAQPLFVMFGGETCYFRCSELSPMENTPAIAQQYMDAIEYANGPESSKWGSVRARAGHAKPFEQLLVGIGNENWLQPYIDRYKVIYKTIKDKYPDYTTIACVEPKNVKIDMLDIHYYCSPRWFFNTENFAEYDRKSAPVYIGELATYSRETAGGYNMIAGLSEAAYMLHLENNSDVIKMVSYAPLIANADGRTGWHGCINFNTYQIFGTPSYWVQQVYSNNLPSYTVASQVQSDIKPSEFLKGKVGIECIRLDAAFKDLKVEKDGKVIYASDFTKGTEGWEKGDQWKLEDGALRTEEYGWASYGDQKWEDCSVSVKMKWNETKNKDAGAFILHFATAEGNNDNWWKIDQDGTGNNANAGDTGHGGQRLNLEKGRWYEMKVEVKGLHVRCLLDGEVVNEFDVPPIQKLVANAGYDEKTGEIVVKVVNSFEEPISTSLNITGAAKIAAGGRVITLAAKSLTEQNSFDKPKNIVPVSNSIDCAGSRFTYEFPPCSLTVLRLKAK